MGSGKLKPGAHQCQAELRVPRQGCAPRAPRSRTHPDQRRAGHPAAPCLALEERGDPHLHVPEVCRDVPRGSGCSGLCRGDGILPAWLEAALGCWPAPSTAGDRPTSSLVPVPTPISSPIPIPIPFPVPIPGPSLCGSMPWAPRGAERPPATMARGHHCPFGLFPMDRGQALTGEGLKRPLT